ncbi:MAG: AmmeMemoRadiSam system radical SAM enzyme [Thermodesulfobacteriota bacterium]
MALTRRRFLLAAAAAGAACAAGGFTPAGAARAAQRLALTPGLIGQRPSPFYEPLANGFVQCTLCPQACRLGPGETGACRVRRNIAGVHHTLVYANPCAAHLDPIEKKPFFHVLPGTRSFSLATAGCNFGCRFCQNWEISQQGPADTLNLALTPAEAAAEAADLGAASLASTYVEPVIFMEYMLDLGREARRRGMLKVMHSNGFVNPGPLRELIGVLDAACIDLKSARDRFYRDICGGALKPVQATLKALAAAGVHTEIVHLMIPSLNDDPAETRDLARFVAGEVGPQTPLHLSRFAPRYKLTNLPPTPVATLERARDIAMEAGLKYVYLGNVAGHWAENTYCPGCQRLLLKRRGMATIENHLAEGRCPGCGRTVPGIWRMPARA